LYIIDFTITAQY